MLRIGKGASRASVRRGLKSKRPRTFTYRGVLETRHIRDAVAGIRDAGSPRWAWPLLAWIAGHPNAPEEVLRDLFAGGGRAVLISLALNPNLPADLRQALAQHSDEDVREHAQHVLSSSRGRKH